MDVSGGGCIMKVTWAEARISSLLILTNNSLKAEISFLRRPTDLWVVIFPVFLINSFLCKKDPVKGEIMCCLKGSLLKSLFLFFSFFSNFINIFSFIHLFWMKNVSVIV